MAATISLRQMSPYSTWREIMKIRIWTYFPLTSGAGCVRADCVGGEDVGILKGFRRELSRQNGIKELFGSRGVFVNS